MRTAVAILRWILWGEAAVFLLGSLTLASFTGNRSESFELPLWIVLGELFLGTVAFVAALAMQMRWRWAVAAGLTASALTVLLIPVGTPFGIFGLIVLCKKSGRNQLGPKPPPLPGAPPSKRPHVADVVLTAATIAVCPILFQYLQVSHVPSIPIPLLVLGFFAEAWIAVLAHELGHLVVGWACGFELVQFAVGRTVLVRQDERWQVKRAKKPGAGGWVAIRPRTLAYLREKYVLFVAGGPVASLLFAVLLFGLFLASPGRPWQLLSPIIGITAMISLQTFLGNSFPAQSRRGMRDGKRILELSRDSTEGRRVVARLQTSMIFTSPLRPRDLPDAWIRTALGNSDSSNSHLAGCIPAYEYLLDRGEIDVAGKWLDEWLRIDRLLPGDIGRDRALTEIAYFEARYRGNAVAARTYLQDAQRQFMVERYSTCRAWAAVMLAEGNCEAASELISQARADLDRRPVTGHRLFERDLLGDLEQSASQNVLELPCATVPV